MTATITHAKVSAVADNAQSSSAGEVLPSDWNSNHTISNKGNISTASDTNVTIAASGTPTGATLENVTLMTGWTGTLAASRLNSNVVQSAVNDTNVTGSIAAQTLTLGWTGTLAPGRLNANVVQAVVNDTNVTGSISAQSITLGWTGTLALSRLAQGTSGQVIIGQTGLAPAYASISGDGSLSAIGALTVTKLNGVAPGAFFSGTDATNLTGTINNARLSAIPNTALANSSITIAGHAVALGGSQTLAASDVGLGSVTNDVQTKAAIVPNTAPSAGQVLVGNGTAYAPQSVSGDITLASTGAATIANGVVTLAKIASAAIATAAQYLANTASLILTTDKVWAAAAPVILTDAATITPDFGAGINFSVTLAGNRTLANPTNLKAGQCGEIVITQDATGSRTLSFGSSWKFTGGTAPTISTTAGASDKLFYIVESGSVITAIILLNVK